VRVCRRKLQCVAARCSVLNIDVVRRGTVYVYGCCNMLQRVALWCVAVC